MISCAQNFKSLRQTIKSLKTYFYYISGLKVYETNENELVIEPAFRWAGNPNIVMVVNIMSLRITFQVNYPKDNL